MVLKAIVVGAGERGKTYSSYAKYYPNELKIIAVAEPRQFYRDHLSSAHDIKSQLQFQSWKDMVTWHQNQECIADFVIIATPDREHTGAAIAFAKLGYHILLEKPMAVTAKDCKMITTTCEKFNVMLCVCHVLRYSPSNRKIKELIQSGVIGKVINIQHREPVGFYHFAHSFVRGNWKQESESAPSLLAKSCHDIDLICYWMEGNECTSVSSFGNLNHFNSESQPSEAQNAVRCINCLIQDSCPYSAKKIYLDLVKKGHSGWPVSVITEVPDIESVTEAISNGPYGRCVYHCDNDVVDSQVVIMEFENGANASFSMVAFTEKICTRETIISGTLGELKCVDAKTVRHFDFGTRKVDMYTPEEELPQVMGGHGGADYHLMKNWVKAVASGDPNLNLTSAKKSLNSHLLVFDAELARKKGIIVRR